MLQSFANLHNSYSDDLIIDDDDQELMRSLIKMLQSLAYLAQEPSSVWVLLPPVQIRPV